MISFLLEFRWSILTSTNRNPKSHFIWEEVWSCNLCTCKDGFHNKNKKQYAIALWKTIVQRLLFFGKPLSHLSVWHPDTRTSFTLPIQLDRQTRLGSGTKTSKHRLYGFRTTVRSATDVLPWRTVERTFSPGERGILAREWEVYHTTPFTWSAICWVCRQLGSSYPIYLVQSLSPE